MGKNVKVDFKEFAEFQKRIETLNSNMRQDFIEQCAKELAARLLRKVIKRTPVGKYKTAFSENGMVGGTLKRAWTKNNKDLVVIRSGNLCRIEIVNPTYYASYVEFGHRQEPGRFVPTLGKRLKQGWVPGLFMMTISAQEIQSMAPTFLQKKLESKLREAFK